MTENSKVAVVTGAGSGIGRAAALAFLRDGYCVVLAGRHEQTLAAVAQLGGAPERMLVVPTDVTHEASVLALFDTAVRHFGRVDVLFNNAGISAPPVLLEDLTLAEHQRIVEAIATHDADGAERAMREHLLRANALYQRAGQALVPGA